MKNQLEFPLILGRFLKLSSHSVFLLTLACGQAKVPTGAESSNTLPTPSILAPGSHHVSKIDSLTISGSCLSSSTVTLEEGSTIQTTSCLDSRFSFSTSQASDGIFNYRIYQSDSQGNSSGTTTVTWSLDRTAPLAPLVTHPSTNPGFSNKTVLNLTGTCENGATVTMAGSTSGSVRCLSSTFSLAATQSTDGNYTFVLTQTDAAGNTSNPLTYVWTRDTVAPAAPTITAPNTTPYTSGETSFQLSGACEVGGKVSITGSLTDEQDCTSGTYQLTLSATTDGTYNYVITQRDAAGNSSSGTSFQWVKSATSVPAPTITSPASSPLTNNASSLTISGACANGATVTLGGNVIASDVTSPSNSLTQTCAGSAFSYTVAKTTDATYNFNVTQTMGTETSAATNTQWTRDTVAPLSPIIVTPASSPIITNGNSLEISGLCENGSSLSLSGDATGTSTCSSSSFSFTVNKTVDGNYNFNVSQSDAAGNVSLLPANVQWIRNTATPPAPVLSSPSPLTYISNGNSVTVAGSCLDGNTVNISGDATDSATCSSSSFSFVVNKIADATYNFSVTQTNAAATSSAAATTSWTRDTVNPATPVLTSPNSSPLSSNGASLTLAGACEIGATVNLSGDDAQSAVCSGSSFTFTVSESLDGTYNYSVSQTDAAGNSSSGVSQQWVRNTTLPPAPTLTSPTPLTFFSNGNSVTVAGGCVNGNTVMLTGDSNDSVICSSNAFSFTVNKIADATYNFNVTQTDSFGNTSPAASATWTRDTVAPSVPTVSTPASNPYTSSGNTVALSGACETGATVSMTGAETASSACSAGVYNLTLNQSTDGSYTYSLTQTDLAGNTSTGTSFEWVRAAETPTTPTIAVPSLNPLSTNTSVLIISGACTIGFTVHLGGDVLAAEVSDPASSLDQVCSAGGSYSYTIGKSADGTFSFTISQTNPITSLTSAEASQTWIFDTLAPAPPFIANPSSSPYTAGGNLTINGTCESGSTVALSGDSNQTASCISDNFSFTVVKSVDATYNFSLNQSDVAGNISSPSILQWIRSTSVTPPPVVTTPATASFSTNTSTVTLSGTCLANHTVTIGGNVSAPDVTSPAGSLTQACSGGTFTFTVSKSSDAIYNIHLTQTSPDLVTSALVDLYWTLDTTAPETTIATTPSNPNLSQIAAFTFTASEGGATYECSLDGAAYSSCSTPYSLTALSNSSHTLNVRAKDSLGNADSTPATYNWTQSAYNTVALYHFNNAITDSSLFTSAENNGLTDSGTTNSATSKFAQSRFFAVGSNAFLSKADNNSLDTLNSVMTFDAWVRVTTLPTNTYTPILASKMGASGQMGWEIRLAKSGAKQTISFIASTNGTTTTEIKSSAQNLGTAAFNHIAVTWNRGSVAIYLNGTLIGSGTIGTAGSATIFNSTAPLRLGRSESVSNHFEGYLDEVRLSQTVRWSTGFTPPAAEYGTPD